MKMNGPLSHIRVLDLSRVLAGPWSTQILADLGAEVIKVEKPGSGDDTRAWGPPFVKDKEDSIVGAGYYFGANRGKRSITLDLSTSDGQNVIKKLVESVDVVVENYKVGTLDRYGIGWKDLSKINKKLVYCSITGFGQDGPRASLPAYDFLIQAMGGLMSVTGVPDGEPGAGPQKVGIPIIDLITGVYASSAINAALAGREKTGNGQYIDIAMLDVAISLLSNQAMNTLLTGNTPKRLGNAHPNIQPQKVYRCKDGDIVLVVGNDGQFEKLCSVLRLYGIASDPLYATNGCRIKNQSTLQPLIENSFLQKNRSEWLQLLADAGVPAGPINTVPQALAEEQVKHRGMVKEYFHPEIGNLKLVMSPFKFNGENLNSSLPPPIMGEHNNQVFEEFGIN